MKSQVSFEEELAYCRNIIHSLKNRQNIDSSYAQLYLDSRTNNVPFILPLSFTVGEAKNIRVTYSHPLGETPYSFLQYDIVDLVNINYTNYREAPVDPFVTQWVVRFINLSGAVTSGSVRFGVKSSAPGTVSAVVI